MLVNVLSVFVSPESVANALASSIYILLLVCLSVMSGRMWSKRMFSYGRRLRRTTFAFAMCVGFCHVILFHAMFMKCHAFVCHATPCGPLAATVRDTGQLVLAHTVPRQSAAATRGLPLRGPPFEDLPSRPPFARPPFRVLPLEAFLCEATLSRPSPLLPPRGLPCIGQWTLEIRLVVPLPHAQVTYFISSAPVLYLSYCSGFTTLVILLFTIHRAQD